MPIVLDPVNGITQATWTTAGRPGSPVAGQVGFNTSLNALEQYTGSAWETIPTWTTSNRPVTPAAGYSGYNTDTKAFEFYNGTSWIGFNQSNLSTTASYLLVAGGGGGGGNAWAGGGGAGGLLTGTTTLNLNTTYFVTVGAGGNGGGAAANGTPGGNSTFPGITTAVGGGGGLYGDQSAITVGLSGGSGGGTNRAAYPGGAGTPGQGNAGGAGENTNGYGGGGGGAGAVGANAGVSTSAAGGTGVTSSISGTSITYAGGGGGGSQIGIASGGTNGGPSGSPGGGGAGGSKSPAVVAAVSGLVNTGGGGGGNCQLSPYSNPGGSGGSGVAIISYPGSQVFTGGTVTTSGGNTIHTFTTSAALLPTTNGSTFNNSLRFRSSASAYLNRTFTTPTNNKIWTWSAWVKRGSLTSTHILFATSGDELRYIADGGASGVVDSFQYNLSTGTYGFRTNATYRDVSAWYHIVVAVDTTQASAVNRAKIYINGIEASTDGTYGIVQNANTQINSAVAHNIGRRTSGSLYYDGYMSNVQFIDGQQLSAAYFGTNNSNGVWVPIPYTGTYGTNGFFLNFGDGPFLTTSSNTGIGKDSSGNGNYWATNNISVTTGSTFDLMTDVPTLTSATVANYPTLNPLMAGTPFQTNAAATVSQGNLQADWGTTSQGSLLSTIAMTSGKWYFEGTVTGTNTREVIGIVNSSAATTTYAGGDANGWGYFSVNGNKYNNGSATSYGATYTTNDIIGVAFDADAGSLTFYKNNVSQGTAFTGLASGTYFFAVSDANSSLACGWNVNFGQRPFAYTPPSGFVALNTYNLSTPTILQGNLYMDATLYNGTGSALTVTNRAGFKPDFVWVKQRSGVVRSHRLEDSVRGATKALYSDLTDAETTEANSITAFNSNGFSVNSQNGVGNSGETYVGWQWQAGQGTTSSNTQGSITSTVSVNTTAGFSIVTWTGTGSPGTVGHGLGVAPKMVISKKRNGASDWAFWITGFAGTELMEMNGTSGKFTGATVWNSTTPTSTVFSVGSATQTNNSGGTYVAYLWSEIAGFSRFGSYTGNGSADGPFVYLGFLPKYIMIKRTDTTASWVVMDTSRGLYNASYYYLLPNLSDADSGPIAMDFLSNGFKLRLTSAAWNASGGTYIYAAFAENPFKYANAR